MWNWHLFWPLFCFLFQGQCLVFLFVFLILLPLNWFPLLYKKKNVDTDILGKFFYEDYFSCVPGRVLSRAPWWGSTLGSSQSRVSGKKHHNLHEPQCLKVKWLWWKWGMYWPLTRLSNHRKKSTQTSAHTCLFPFSYFAAIDWALLKGLGVGRLITGSDKFYFMCLLRCVALAWPTLLPGAPPHPGHG